MIETLEHPKLFCFRVDRWPKWIILLVCSVGIFGSFLLHGVAHEKLFSAPYFFKETLFLTFAQFFSYSAMSLPGLARIIRNRVPLKAPWSVYLLTTFCLAMSMSLANFAAMRLSYATKVLFKSSKLIPVMIGNIIFLKKKPKATEVLSVVLIVIGLVGISLGDFSSELVSETSVAKTSLTCPVSSASLCHSALMPSPQTWKTRFYRTTGHPKMS